MIRALGGRRGNENMRWGGVAWEGNDGIFGVLPGGRREEMKGRGGVFGNSYFWEGIGM